MGTDVNIFLKKYRNRMRYINTYIQFNTKYSTIEHMVLAHYSIVWQCVMSMTWHTHNVVYSVAMDNAIVVSLSLILTTGAETLNRGFVHGSVTRRLTFAPCAVSQQRYTNHSIRCDIAIIKKEIDPSLQKIVE